MAPCRDVQVLCSVNAFTEEQLQEEIKVYFKGRRYQNDWSYRTPVHYDGATLLGNLTSCYYVAGSQDPRKPIGPNGLSPCMQTYLLTVLG